MNGFPSAIGGCLRANQGSIVEPLAQKEGSTSNVRPSRVDPPRESGAGGNASLIAQLAEELVDAWRRGESPKAEEYLNRHPELQDDPEAVAQLVYEEVCLRQELGREVDPNEYLRRFPQWQSKLAVLLDCHGLMQPSEAPSLFPNVGEVFEDYSLVAELGRGALGRIFLATQPLLADRPVVLKLTPRQGQEHWSLARLQHTHIVPLYAAQDHEHGNLRSLCMPYLGGATLARILPIVTRVPPGQRTGRHLLSALDQLQSKAAIKVGTAGPARQFFGHASYEQAICWIGACLADALDYAHQRGLVHLDVKPSNVLLTADAQPMLLDFHLAREPLRPGGPGDAWLGGTPEYMPPEQQRAFNAIRSSEPATETVDGRADVFALGVLLYTSLGGELPVPKDAAGMLRSKNPRISPGIAALIARCLAPESGKRYARAASVAEDLRRHLNDLPLRGVTNRSPRERFRKWRGRHPYGLAWSAVFAVVLFGVLAAGVSSLSSLRDRQKEATNDLAEGRQLYQVRAYPQAIHVLSHGLQLCRDLPASDDLTNALSAQLEQTQRAQGQLDLHALVERLRFLTDGVNGVPPDELGKMAAHAAELWEARGRLLSDDSYEVRGDLLELVLFWLDGRERLTAAGGLLSFRQEALRVLAEAETVLGPSRALERQREVLASSLGLHQEADTARRRAERLAPRTSWEHYQEGRALLRARDPESAQTEFAEAAALAPHDFWPHFYQGLCAYRLKHPQEAVAAFSVCIALEPDRAECYYNRGLALAVSGRAEEASRDFDRALELAPDLAAAALERAVLHIQAGHYEKALGDLQRARAHGGDRAAAYYNEALVHQARHDLPAARASLEQALRADPGHTAARALRARLQDGDH